MTSPLSPQASETPATPAAAPPPSVPDQRSVNTQKKQAPAHPTAAQDPHLPKLPHERDQSVDMTDGIASVDMQQAYLDVARGLVNTDAALEAHKLDQPRAPDSP